MHRSDAEFYSLFDSQVAAINYVTMLVGCEWPQAHAWGSSMAVCRKPCVQSSWWRHCLCPSQDLTAGLQDVSPHCATPHSFALPRPVYPADADLVYSREVGVDIRLGAGHATAVLLLGLLLLGLLFAWSHCHLRCCLLMPNRLRTCCPCAASPPTASGPPTHSAACRPPGAAARCQGARLPRRLPEREHCQGPRRSGACCGLLPRAAVERRSADWLGGVRHTPGLVAWSMKGRTGAPSTARLRMLPVAWCSRLSASFPDLPAALPSPAPLLQPDGGDAVLEQQSCQRAAHHRHVPERPAGRGGCGEAAGAGAGAAGDLLC